MDAVAGGPPRASSWLPGARGALPLCIAVSLAAHLLLLTMRAPPAPPRQAARAPYGLAGKIQARLLVPSAPNMRSDITTRVGPMAHAGSKPAAASSVPTNLAAPDRPAPPPEPSRSAPTTKASDEAPQPALDAEAPMLAEPKGAAIQDDYVPRPLLTIAPVAQTPVVIAAPDGEDDGERHVGILALFIDETGQVQWIEANEPLLPAPLERAAREAFMAARFSPGEVDSRAVKSRVRVEVVFDSTPLDDRQLSIVRSGRLD